MVEEVKTKNVAINHVRAIKEALITEIQQSNKMTSTKKSKIFNKTIVSPLEMIMRINMLDEQLNQNKNINFFIEEFENKKGYTVLNQQKNKNKISGDPSLELNKDDNFNLRFRLEFITYQREHWFRP